MKILVVELTQDTGYYTTKLDSKFIGSFESECEKNGVSPEIIEVLLDQEVYGWVEQQNRFNETIKRTFILLEK